MVLQEFRQTPTDVLDYTISYASWLTTTAGGDTISSATWKVPPGLTAANSSNTTTTATNWLSGGTSGVRYVVTCTIVTAASPSRTKAVSIAITIEGAV